MKNNKYLITCFVSLSLILANCGGIPYRIDINQGNEISRASLEKLSLGMTKDEVQMSIGRSLLNDVFHLNRWDYVQYYKSGRTKEIQEGLVSLYFTNGLLSQINDEKLIELKEEPLSYGIFAKQDALELEDMSPEVIIGPGAEK